MKQEEITIQKFNELLIKKRLEEIYPSTNDRICPQTNTVGSRKSLKSKCDKYITIKLKTRRRAL